MKWLFDVLKREETGGNAPTYLLLLMTEETEHFSSSFHANVQCGKEGPEKVGVVVEAMMLNLLFFLRDRTGLSLDGCAGALKGVIDQVLEIIKDGEEEDVRLPMVMGGDLPVA